MPGLVLSWSAKYGNICITTKLFGLKGRAYGTISIFKFEGSDALIFSWEELSNSYDSLEV